MDLNKVGFIYLFVTSPQTLHRKCYIKISELDREWSDGVFFRYVSDTLFNKSIHEPLLLLDCHSSCHY